MDDNFHTLVMGLLMLHDRGLMTQELVMAICSDYLEDLGLNRPVVTGWKVVGKDRPLTEI